MSSARYLTKHPLLRRPSSPGAQASTASASTGSRAASSLRDVVFAQIPAKQKELKELGAKYSEKKLGDVTVSQVRPGARPRAPAPAPAPDAQRARSFPPSSPSPPPARRRSAAAAT